MDAYEVIKSIEHFFGNVLPSAYSYENWSEDGIAITFHWAQFCEKIYQTYKDKPIKNKLDKLICHMARSFQNKHKSLCFEDLNRSLSMLHEAFCENPTIIKDGVKLAFIKLKFDKHEFRDFKDDNILDSLCYELIEAVKPLKIVNSDRSMYYEIKAEIYLNLLRDSTLHLTSEEQVEKYLTDALEKLCKNRDEMVLFLHVLSHRLAKSDDLYSTAEIQEFTINWTILKILSEENCAFEHLLWRQTSRLRAISLNSPNFLHVYLEFITNSATTLSCEFEDNEMKWISRSSGRGITLSFDEILNHFQSLLKDEDDVCETTKKYLLNLLDAQPEVPIYKEIFCRVT